MYCILDSLTFFPSAIGEEHEVLLRDKLKERNLSFLGKPFSFFPIFNVTLKMFLYVFFEKFTTSWIPKFLLLLCCQVHVLISECNTFL